MELVSTGARDNADLPAGVAAEAGVVGGCRDFEFADRIHGRRHGDAVQLRIAVVSSVQEEIVGVFARAVHIDGEIAAHRAGRSLSRRNHTGQQQAELVKVAPVERQAEHLPAVDDAAQSRGLRPHDGRRRGHRDFIGHSTGEKGNLEADFLVDLKRDSPDVFPVTFVLHFQAIGARREHRDGKAPLGAGDHTALRIGLFADQGHRRGSHRLPRRIRHFASDDAAHRLRLRRGDEYSDGRCKLEIHRKIPLL